MILSDFREEGIHLQPEKSEAQRDYAAHTLETPEQMVNREVECQTVFGEEQEQ